jgi:hypothetical protein
MGVAEIGSISRPESWLLPCLLGFGFGGDRHGVFLAFRLDLPEASCREIPIVGVQDFKCNWSLSEMKFC